MLCVIVAASWATSAMAQETPAWRFDEVPTAIFANQDHAWRIGYFGELPASAALVWGVTVADRTFARGEAQWEKRDDGSHAATVTWRAPPLKDDVVIAARCTFTITQGNRSIAESTIQVWLFPSDPLAARGAWLKNLNLVLLTSTTSTKRWRDEVGLPCRTISSMVAIQRLESEILLIADVGTSDRNRSLPGTVADFVHRGGRCLWLTPPLGAVVLTSGDEGPHAGPNTWERISLRRHSVIHDFDKRLDANIWRPMSSDQVAFHLVARKDSSEPSHPVWEATTADGAWPWLEATTADGGRLMLCGYPIVRHWDRGPTPRYLFLRLLESLEDEGSTGTGHRRPVK